MNIRRGLLRGWIAFAALWVAYTIWSFYSGCFEFINLDGSHSGQTMCPTGELQGSLKAVATLKEFRLADWLRWVSMAALWPLGMLGFGLLMGWIGRGFTGPPSSNR